MMKTLVLLLLLSVVAVTLADPVEEREETAEGSEIQGEFFELSAFDSHFSIKIQGHNTHSIFAVKEYV